MATPFRQLIRPGDEGRDVKAVKRAMVKMRIARTGAMRLNGHAGDAFVACIRQVERSHGIKSDGIYGKQTHAIVAPHFDAYGSRLYRTAKIRKPPIPPTPAGGAQANAKTLLELNKAGHYHADNPADLTQIELTAAGKPVWSAQGKYVHLDPRVLQLLVWLIEDKHFKIGTYALCTDHGNDGPNGHAGGKAVDISSVNGVAVSSPGGKALTLELAKLLHGGTPAALHPWQLICDGYGYQHDAAISACTIPNAGFYGYTTMSEHRNHIHVGYH